MAEYVPTDGRYIGALSAPYEEAGEQYQLLVVKPPCDAAPDAIGRLTRPAIAEHMMTTETATIFYMRGNSDSIAEAAGRIIELANITDGPIMANIDSKRLDAVAHNMNVSK